MIVFLPAPRVQPLLGTLIAPYPTVKINYFSRLSMPFRNVDVFQYFRETLKGFSMNHACFCVFRMYCITIRRLRARYSPFSIKRPPSIKRRLSKVPIHLSVNCCIWYLYSTATSVKWPRSPFFCRKCIIFIWFFASIKWPANYLSKRNGDRWYIRWQMI